jgi:hypothetical protein|tara:strand:+ start:226 stop:351 length:126 start_codon:yes stop_codon:yes gene_type:complete
VVLLLNQLTNLQMVNLLHHAIGEEEKVQPVFIYRLCPIITA